MTNEDAIKWLETLKQDISRLRHEDLWPYVRAIDEIMVLLKEQEWKLITEDSDGILHGLPGDDGTYLMTDGKDIWIDEYVDGVADGIFLDSGRDIREIKAWMYMPELPEQKGGEIG